MAVEVDPHGDRERTKLKVDASENNIENSLRMSKLCPFEEAHKR